LRRQTTRKKKGVSEGGGWGNVSIWFWGVSTCSDPEGESEGNSRQGCTKAINDTLKGASIRGYVRLGRRKESPGFWEAGCGYFAQPSASNGSSEDGDRGRVSYWPGGGVKFGGLEEKRLEAFSHHTWAGGAKTFMEDLGGKKLTSVANFLDGWGREGGKAVAGKHLVNPESGEAPKGKKKRQKNKTIVSKIRGKSSTPSGVGEKRIAGKKRKGQGEKGPKALAERTPHKQQTQKGNQSKKRRPSEQFEGEGASGK